MAENSLSTTNHSVKSYFDLAGLSHLRARARGDEQAAAKEVGQQFEAMFLQMVFKSMREASEPLKSDLTSSSSLDTFEQMYHQELAQTMAQNGSLGLGDWLAEQVTQQANLKPANPQQVAEAYKTYSQSMAVQQPLPLEQPARPRQAVAAEDINQ